ncbi:MAG: ABC transporter substrate-binding protein [Microbacterium sp.]
MLSKVARRRAWLSVVSGGIVLAVALAGCSAPPAGEDGDTRDKITIGYTAEDASFDPNLSIVTAWLSVLSNVYDTLVRRNADGELEASLGTEWRQVDDLTWEISLQKDVVFHDGTPFTADDVVYTFERVLGEELGSPQRTYIASIDKVEAVDPSTVRVHTSAPFPLLIDNLQFIPIVSKAFTEKDGASGLTRAANGTGPYQLESWKQGADIVLSAAADNWRGAPDIEDVVFRPIPEVGARVAALQAGEIDIAVGVQPETADMIESADGLRIESVRSQRSNYIVIDNTVAPFDDVRVRQAVNYAVDKQGIIDNLMLGHGSPLPSMVGPMYRGYDESLEPYPYDPDKARKLLAEAGYPDGFPLVFNSSDVRPKDREIAQAITAQLKDVGIQVDNQVTEWGAFLDRYKQHDLGPFYIISFGTPVWDFGVPFNSYLMPESPQAYFRDDAIQARVVEAAKIADPDERQSALAALNADLYDQAAFLYLFSYQDIYGVSDRIDWTATSDERIWVYDAKVQKR